MDVCSAAERIRQHAEGLGHEVREHQATTGTVYLRVGAWPVEVTVRVADHAEAYPPARGERKLLCSQYELSAEQVCTILSRGLESVEPYSQEITDEERAAYEAHRQQVEQQAAGWS